MKTRQEIRENIKEICSTLDLIDDIKKELMFIGNKENLLMEIDKVIRKIEDYLLIITSQMVKNDICDCDGIYGGCSSPLCRSRYNIKCSKNETACKKK